MKHRLTLIPLSILILAAPPAIAQVSAFTYQGQLKVNGAPANGLYDFMFRLMNAPTNGAAAPVIPINPAVPVSNGLFTTGLDFGLGSFDGTNLWLEVNVRSNNTGGFAALAPRQLLTSTPYAIRSINASNLLGNLSAAQINGTILNASLPSNPVFSGTVTASGIAGSGSGLSNVNATTLGGLNSSNFWRTTGNAGTTPGTHFLGTTDNQALEVKVNGLRTLRMEFSTNASGSGPNLIGGAPINFVDSGAVGATIAGGGTTNYLGGASSNSVLSDFGSIGGGLANRIAPSALAATIAGGRGNLTGTNADYSAIGGGGGNTTAAGALYATIAGGDRNNIGQGGYGTIGGGGLNKLAASAVYSTIAGGYQNDIGMLSRYSAIGGGDDNNIATFSDYATIAGGLQNDIGTNCYASTIGGGYDNNIANNSAYAIIAGGEFNRVGGSAGFSVISGGKDNNVGATAEYATIPGGQDNAAGGNHSFAAGYRAKANHDGAFVWADSTDADFASTGNDQFLIRASGGVGINVTNPVDALHVQSPSSLRVRTTTTGTGFAGFLSENSLGEWFAGIANGTNHWYLFENAPSAGARLVVKSGGNVGIGTVGPTNKLHVIGGVSATAFVTTSDRNAKENFLPISPREVLDKVAALPISTWNYKDMRDGRHMGPMAQDFHAAFGLGGGDTTITSVDPDGVALAAIQGLNQKLEQQLHERDGRIARLEKELEGLKTILGRVAQSRE